MSDFVYSVTLVEHPLPDILNSVSLYQVPGTLTCSNAGEELQVFFDNGAITGARSVRPPGSLATRLAGRGAITPEQLRKVEEWRESGHGEEEAILVAIGALSPAGLDLAKREYVSEIVLNLFDWADGQATITLGRAAEAGSAPVTVPARELILEGIRRLKDAKRALAAVGHKDTLLEPAVDAFQLLEGLQLSKDERRLMRMVDGEKTFYALVQAGMAAGMSQATAVKAIYALSALRLISKKPGPVKMKSQ
jgi:hypothetical protein